MELNRVIKLKHVSMRVYVNITYDRNADLIEQMHVLSNPLSSVEEYRESFYRIGKALGELLNKETDNRYGNTMLACASEDADWLARGVMETISTDKLSLAVFWNERVMLDEKTKLEYSPIVKSYIEPIKDCETLILVKSIISTSCVVKTQLTRLVNEINPKEIYILAPVMYRYAKMNLEKEFPESISSKFRFVTLAIDTVRDSKGCVLPGIGGMVYPRLGLGDVHKKNKYIPEIVRTRMID